MILQSLDDLASALESARAAGVTSAVLVTIRDGSPHALIVGLTPLEVLRYCNVVVNREVQALVAGGEN